MPRIIAVIRRHPTWTYFGMVFAIVWGTFFILVGPPRIAATDDEIGRLMPLLYTVMMASTSATGILLNRLVGGREGLRDVLSRLSNWRVGAHWYAVALLTTPVIATATLIARTLTSPDFASHLYDGKQGVRSAVWSHVGNNGRLL